MQQHEHINGHHQLGFVHAAAFGSPLSSPLLRRYCSLLRRKDCIVHMLIGGVERCFAGRWW
jgi:hypothetical protein